MSPELGNLCKLAGAAVGTYFCPGLGTAIGSAAGRAVGDIIDGKDSDKNQAVAKNDSGLGLGNILSGSGDSSSLLNADPTKLVSIFAAV